MQAARVLAVLALTAGAMAVTAPAFATDGVSATACDTLLTSVQPGGCVTASEWGPRVVEFPFVSSDACSGDTPLVPTVTEFCIVVEIDSPTPIAARP